MAHHIPTTMEFINYTPPAGILFNIEKYYDDCNIINGNVAFTEDNIPVRTVYASPIPHFLRNHDIKKYMEKFGPVAEVNIYSKKAKKFCFVTFNTCEDAVKCLKFDKHMLNRKRLRVSIADSWHQPKDTVVPPDDTEQPSTSAAGSSPAQSTDEPSVEVNRILCLNDYCLMHIFSYLDLIELVKLADVCDRFKEIVTNLFGRYKNFDFKNVKGHNNLTLMESREILHHIGPYIQNIVVPSEKFKQAPHRLLEMIPKFCLNLVGLTLDGFYVHDTTFRKYNSLFRKLKSLEMGCCGFDGDSIERHLSRATNLEKLDISKNHDVRGSCFKNFKHLRHLNVDRCINLQPKFITDIFTHNPELRYLNINRVDRLTTANVTELVNNCKRLEHLVMSHTYDCVRNIEEIGGLEALKKLQVMFINTNSQLLVRLLEVLLERNQIEHLELSSGNLSSQMLKLLLRFDKLEVLILNHNMEVNDEFIRKLGDKGRIRELHIAGNTNVSDESLLYFVERSPHLELLDLSHCFGLTDTLVMGTVDIMRNRKQQAPRPIRLLLGGTLVSGDIVESAKLLEQPKLVKVSFVKTMDPAAFIDGIDDFDDDDCDDYDLEDEDDYDIEDDEYEFFLGQGNRSSDDEGDEYYPWFF